MGREQARLVAHRLSKETVGAVYSSDLVRALETARAIAAYHSVDVVVDTALRECSFGEWEGLTASGNSRALPG